MKKEHCDSSSEEGNNWKNNANLKYNIKLYKKK